MAQIKADPEIQAIGATDAQIREYVDNLFDKNNPAPLVFKDYGPSISGQLNMSAVLQLVRDDSANPDGTIYYDSHADQIVAEFATNAGREFARQLGVDFNKILDPTNVFLAIDPSQSPRVVNTVRGITTVGNQITSSSMLEDFKELATQYKA